MKIINLFLIILILYLIYKIVIRGENFKTQDTIDLSDKDIINSKNIFINIEESRLEEINKIPELDLSKNNLIIDNRYGKVSISDKLCVGNYCINSDKLKSLTGEIDGAQFYAHNKKDNTDSPKYYNHDCGIGIDNSNSFKCEIDKDIDYPSKLCFNYLDNKGKKQEPTCIGPDEFDVLKGVKGIKLKHTTSQQSDTKYMTPYYMDFKQSGNGIEGTKDQLFFKNNDECLGKELLKENTSIKVDLTDKNPRALLKFTQESHYRGCFDQTKTRDYGRKTSDSVLRFDKGNLADLLTQINLLWAAATVIIVAATAAATAILVASWGLAGPAYIYALTQIPSYTKLIKVDIPNIETIMADIKTEYELNWWNGSINGGKKYPYYKDAGFELNCEDVVCSSPKKFMCPNKCKTEIKQSIECGANLNAGGIVTDGTCLDNPVLLYGGNDFAVGEANTHGYYTLKNEFIREDNKEIIAQIQNENPGIDINTIHKTIDPNYNGYYLSKLNNNTKYNIKENAISRVSKFLGDNLNTHRITGDAPRCDNVDELSNTKYYCSGKNGGERDKESLCKPVKFKIDNIIKCVNDKLVDAYDVEYDALPEDSTQIYTPPVGKTKLSEVQDTELNVHYSACLNENSDSLDVNPGQTTISQGPIPLSQGQTTISQGPIPLSQGPIPLSQDQPNEIFNYVISPAKDSDGNDIKANTYFHGHSHIH